MAISITRYVDITSVVGGSSIVPTRLLIGRFFTNNPLLPANTFVQFNTSAEVGTYFGFMSEEYYRASFYFNWISKNGTQPQAIQFARWVQLNTPPMIFPIPLNGSILSNWTAITSGSFILTMGAFTFSLSGMNFSAAGSLAAVATIVQDAIQAQTGGGALWTSATVTYSSSYGGFLLVGGASGNYVISVTAGGGGTDITNQGLLGWIPESTDIDGNFTSGAIWANGALAETITQALINSTQASNNFGSFAFLTNLNLTLQNVLDAANWNNSQNVLFMYSQAVIPTKAVSWANALSNIGGIGLTLSSSYQFSLTGTLTSGLDTVTGLSSNTNLYVGMSITDVNGYIPLGTTIATLVGTTGLTLSNIVTGTATELLTFVNTQMFSSLQFPEEVPMMIEAATDYTMANSVQNYEFQQFPTLLPSVTNDADADTYDNLSINYYGQTQTAGTFISFYQRGVLMGLSTNPLDMNVYANEQWLKDASTAAIMNALLVLTQIGANAQGRSQVLSILQELINQALLNGTISVGKTLTQTQILFITQVTNDPLAYQSVKSLGYWVDAVITATGSPVVYSVVYTLVYSKDDIIRFVQGTDILI